MSTRQFGNRRENKVVSILRERDYICYPSRGSRGIDLICVHKDDREAPHLAIEVGGPSKVIAASFKDLGEAAKPGGTHCVVARELKKQGRNFFRFHVSPDAFFDDIDAALEVIKHL